MRILSYIKVKIPKAGYVVHMSIRLLGWTVVYANMHL